MISSVTSVPINSTSASVGIQLDDLMAQLRQAAASSGRSDLFHNLRTYNISVDFDQLSGCDEKQRVLRDRAKSIPTLWTISAENRRVIDQAGVLLLHKNPCFQRLLLDLGVNAPFIDAKFARQACPQPGDGPSRSGRH
jgi:hypothetical protein